MLELLSLIVTPVLDTGVYVKLGAVKNRGRARDVLVQMLLHINDGASKILVGATDLNLFERHARYRSPNAAYQRTGAGVVSGVRDECKREAS